MVRKFFVLVLVLLFVVAVWYKLSLSEKQVELNKEAAVVVVSEVSPETVSQLPKEDHRAPITENATISEFTEKEETELAILQELQNRTYSDDPIVEMESIVFQYFQCLPDLKALLFYGQRETDAALMQVEKARTVCPKFKKQFPVISDIDQYKKYKEALVPSSDYGRLKKQRDTALTQGERMTEEVLAAVATQSGPLIAASGLSFRYGVRYEVVPLWNSLLKSSDKNYNAYIMSLATQKLSCEFQNAASCGANSFFMLQKCVADNKYCGVDFMTWYQQVTMPGQQKDVALLIAYLKKAATDE